MQNNRILFVFFWSYTKISKALLKNLLRPFSDVIASGFLCSLLNVLEEGLMALDSFFVFLDLLSMEFSLVDLIVFQTVELFLLLKWIT